jgi:hypothetical protein
LAQDFLSEELETTNDQIYASYSRAIALDSGFAPAYRLALRISGDAGDVEGTHRLAERFLALNPSPASRRIPALIAGLLDLATDTVEAQRLVAAADDVVLWPVLLAIWRLPDSNEVAVRIARETARRTPDPRYWFTTWIAQRNLAAVLAYRGHMHEALEVATPKQSSWFANLFPELVVWGAVPAAQVDSVFVSWQALPGDSLGLNLSVWWWAVRGDTAAVKKVIRLDPRATGSDEAFLALARGDTAEAMRRFAASRDRDVFGHFPTLAKIRLMAARGDVTGALKLLNAREPNDWPIPSHVVWVLERARLSELAGNWDVAARDYQFVMDVWRHADSELQPFVEESRTALARLSGTVPLEGETVRERIGLPSARLQ